ncbi:toll/interleukin-1 receptor domain-containing protein [Amycolatopsis sp. SID8362]|uniref:toll/interleukin-1 receptor domain-containing protein n=1 Tax=Amycolatopsis sp. SID8362 TaxID=2690346 RepID=UPI0013690687|nr:toll/interleukin-1 receptor domain-containing protein [Amycolatopsis sp. SID8362]NBH02727.1 TIR domain-containing protein [Amycolatopsis sp. SID8362]NED39429.1 toll/interleukin-1 receptor domain-containing protein [Amycolatopsis sp. SID8362]
MAAIFISHSSANKSFVKRLAMDLAQRGFEVWYDEWRLDVGARLTETIRASVGASSFVLVAMSAEMLASDWVKRELDQALEMERAEKRDIILPVRLDDSELPADLANRLYADFSKGSYLRSFQTLCAQLHRQLDGLPAGLEPNREIIPLFVTGVVDLDVVQLEERVAQLVARHGAEYVVDASQFRLPDEPEYQKLRGRMLDRMENLTQDPYYSADFAIDFRHRYTAVLQYEEALLRNLATLVTMRGIAGGRFAFATESYRWYWKLMRTRIFSMLRQVQSKALPESEQVGYDAARMDVRTEAVYGVAETAGVHVIDPLTHAFYSVEIDAACRLVQEWRNDYYDGPERLMAAGPLDLLAKWVIPQALVREGKFEHWDTADRLLIGLR